MALSSAKIREELLKQRESLLPQVTIREERQGAPRADNVARMFGNPTSKEQLAVMKSIGDRVAEEQKKMMFSLPKLTPEIKREVLKARAANITREESERAYGLDASTGELTLRGERAYNEALKERERQIDLTPFTEWKARTRGAGSSTDDSAFGNGALRTGFFGLRPQDDSVYDWGLKAEAERKRGEALLAKMKEEDELTAGNLRRLDERMQEKANERAEYEAGLAKAKEEASVHKRESRRQAYAAAGAAVSGDMKASREAGEAYEREAALSDANVTYREEIAKKKAAEKLEYLSSVKYDKEFDRYAARGARKDSPAAELAGRAVEGGDTHRTISEMNADEWRIYNYYIGRGMTERAKEYLAALEPALESRAARTLEAEEHTFAREHPVLGSLKLMLNTLFEPAGMLEVAATNIDNAISDLSGRPQDYKAVNADSALMRPVIQSQALRSGVTADMSPLAAQATDIGLSMGQTAVRLPLGKLGLTTAAMGAASNSARDAVQRGASASQALGIGLTSGFAEYLAEKIPFESLMGMLRAGRKPAQGVIANMLKQAGIEGAEELATEYANVLSDIAIMGEKSEYRTMVRELMESGMSAEEAERAARREFFVDRPAAAFVGGAISGGLFAGGAGAVNAIADSGNDLTKAYGKDMETARRIARSAGTQLRVAELENGVQGEYRDGVITISPTAKDPVRQVLVHELTHHLETSGLYDAFSQRVLSFMAEDSGNSIEQLRASIAQDYAQAGKTLDTDGAARELVAAFCESKLFTDEKSVRRLLHSDGNLFMRVYYWVRDMARKLRGTEEEKFLIDTQRMYEKALRSTGERRGYGDAQNAIVTMPDGRVYVKADRKVINGSDPNEWGRQVENYINEKIRNGEDVVIETTDGHKLNLTERSAYKLKDRNEATISGKKTPMSGADYARKSRAAVHVDEIIQASKLNRYRPDVNQKHANDIGEDGFNYYTAFFQDADGRYYRLMLSSALNNMEETAYNIGAIQERRLPSTRNGSSGKAGARGADGQSPDGGYSPEQMISQSDAASQGKSDIQLALERALGKQNPGQSSIGLSYDEIVRRARERYPQGAGSPTDGFSRAPEGYRSAQNDSVGEELRQAGWTQAAYDGMQKLSRGEVPTAEEARDLLTYMQEQEYELTEEETALLRQSGLANVDEILSNLAARGKRPYTMEEALRANAFPFPEELEAKEGRNPLVAPPAADGKTLSIEDIKIEKPLYASDGSEGKLSAELRKGDVRGRIDRRIRNMQAGEKEKLFAKGVAEGVFSLEDTPRTLDRHVVEELADLYRQRAELKDTGAERARSQAIPVFDQTMYELVEETEGIKGGSTLRMWANTADRNNLRIFGEKLGAEINEALFDPIAANEAERIRFMNRELDRIRALELTDEESYWVQAVGDRTINQTLDDVPAQMRAKVKKAVELFSSIYEQYHVLANNFLVSRGYAPIGYQKGYFPHFTEEEGGIVQALKTLGMDERVTPLDTSAQGQTEFRKPGKKWNPYFLERNGVKTEIDAVKGFERYVSALSDVLYHTDDIQKLRRFEKAIRDRYSSDELSQEIEFQHDKYLNGEQSFDDFMEKRDEALKTLGNVRNLGGYAEWLLNYTNKLAGKQVTPDRAMEALFGRSTLNVGREVQDAFAKSAVFGNISTAINNIIPVVQATGEVKTRSMARAAQEYISGQLDDFIMESDFLSSRAGVDWLSMKPGKAARAMSWPFEKMDELSTVWVTRAKYLDEINAGADHRTALKRADDFARKIVGDRSKGQKALVFEAKNPLMRLLTTFQLEVANNMAHWTQDLPREFRRIRDEKGAKEMAKQLALWFVKWQLATFLANMFIKALTGREPVPGDVGGTVKNLVTDLSNPDMTAGDALGNLGETLVSQVPYLSGAAAMAGIGNGRLPIPQVDDDLLKGLGKFVDDKAGNWQFGLGQAALGAGKTALGFVPGGNQIKKTAQGIRAAVRGGEYSMTEEGERLKFPVGQDPFSIARAVTFGAYADDNARKYVDSGFKSLSAKDTQTIKDAVAAGIDQQKAFDTIKSVKGLKADKDADGNTVKSAAEKQREAIDQNAELTEEERVFFRMALLSDAQKEKAAKLNAKGIDDETFIDIYDTYEKLLGTVNPAGGEKEQAQRRRKKATEFSRYLDGLYLSDAKRAAVDEAFPHTPEGYRLELMSDAAQERYPDAEAAGYTEAEYVKYYPVFTQQKKKDEILDEAVKMGMTKKEAEEFWKIVKAKKEDENPKSTIGKPVLEEKKFVELPIFGPDGKVINR